MAAGVKMEQAFGFARAKGFGSTRAGARRRLGGNRTGQVTMILERSQFTPPDGVTTYAQIAAHVQNMIAIIETFPVWMDRTIYCTYSSVASRLVNRGEFGALTGLTEPPPSDTFPPFTNLFQQTQGLLLGRPAPYGWHRISPSLSYGLRICKGRASFGNPGTIQRVDINGNTSGLCKGPSIKQCLYDWRGEWIDGTFYPSDYVLDENTFLSRPNNPEYPRRVFTYIADDVNPPPTCNIPP